VQERKDIAERDFSSLVGKAKKKKKPRKREQGKRGKLPLSMGKGSARKKEKILQGRWPHYT